MTLGAVLAACGDATVAFPIADVRAILPRPHLVRPPTCVAALAGFADLGSRLLPVLRLHVLLDLPVDGDPEDDLYSHILDLRGDLGLLVGRVLDVAPQAALAASTPPDASYNRCVSAVLDIAGRSVPLLDPARLLDNYETARLDSFRALAADRHASWTASA